MGTLCQLILCQEGCNRLHLLPSVYPFVRTHTTDLPRPPSKLDTSLVAKMRDFFRTRPSAESLRARGILKSKFFCARQRFTQQIHTNFDQCRYASKMCIENTSLSLFPFIIVNTSVHSVAHPSRSSESSLVSLRRFSVNSSSGM